MNNPLLGEPLCWLNISFTFILMVLLAKHDAKWVSEDPFWVCVTKNMLAMIVFYLFMCVGFFTCVQPMDMGTVTVMPNIERMVDVR
jgi:hypothetical protein